jgi:hypothetical protein
MGLISLSGGIGSMTDLHEFHAMSAKTVQGVVVELEKRERDGWELHQAYGLGKNEHFLIFRRPKP